MLFFNLTFLPEWILPLSFFPTVFAQMPCHPFFIHLARPQPEWLCPNPLSAQRRRGSKCFFPTTRTETSFSAAANYCLEPVPTGYSHGMKKERTLLGSEESWMAGLGSVLSCMDWLNAPGLGSLTSAEAFASLSAQNTSLHLQRGQCVWGEGLRGLSFLESIHLASLREKR